MPLRTKAQSKGLSPFRAVADSLSQPAWVADADGVVVHVNRHWIMVTGGDLGASRGDGWMLGICDEDRGLVHTIWECARRDGQASEVECRLCGQYHCQWHRLRFLPLVADDGSIVNWMCLCDNIDRQKRSAEATDFLAQASSTLASSLDYTTTLAFVARLAVPRIADCCLIDLLDESGRFRQVAAAHVDPAWEARMKTLQRPCGDDCACGVGEVLASGKPQIADGGAGWPAAVACDPAERAVLDGIDASSYMIVPLAVRGRRLGTITFVITESKRRYAAEDLLLTQELAHRAALAIDHALMYESAQAEIAHRARTEEALRQSQELFGKAFAASPDAVSISRVSDGWFVDVNPGFLRLSGYARDEVIGVTSLALGIWPDVSGRERLVQMLREQGHVRDYEVVFRIKSGDAITTLLSAQVIDLHGEPHILAVSRDVTERKRIEESLRHSAARLNQAQRSAHIGNWELDLANNELVWSEEIYRIFEIDPTKFSASYEAFLATVHPEDRAAVDLAYTNSVQTHTPYSIDHRLLFPDGRIKYVHEYCETFYDDDRPVRSMGTVQDITERKRIEESLRHSAARFQAQYKALPVPAYIWHHVGEDLILEEYNDAAMRLSGGKVAAAVGKQARSIFAQEPAVVADMENCLRDRTLTRREGLFRQLGTEEVRYFHVTYVFVPPDLVIVYTEDVTAREEAAVRLQLTLKELADAKFAIDQSAIVSSSDVTGRITYVNDKFCEASQYTREELIGSDHRIINSGHHPRAFFEEMWRNIRAGRVWRGEVCNRAKDGSRFWAGTTIVPLLGGEGRPTQYTAIRYDITARKLAEDHVAFQAHMLQLIGEAVIATDLDGRVLYWNRFAEKLYGWPAEEARGRNVVEFIAQDGDRISAVETIEHVKHGHNWIAEQMLERRDGSSFLASLNITPLYDGTGLVTGTIAVINDITERKRLEEDLIKVQKLESIGVLAGGIAHDFNNILTAILGNVTLAKMYLNEGHRSYEVLTEAENAFARARDLTGQLLTFAKGGAPVRKAGSLVPLLLETPRFALTGSNVRCKSLIPDDLWSASFDAGQISQVLNNLMINAKQAMPTGGLVVLSAQNLHLKKGEVSSLPEGDYVRISIHDRGVGIPAEHLRKIFDPYFTTKQQGSGLGLATTYSIVTRHDGQITVESQIGRGSTFSVYLPALRGLVLPMHSEPIQPAAGEGRVLLMDDEAAIRQVAGRLLEGLGYTVDYAIDGAEALDLYRAALDTGQPYCAVILDLTVPAGMGGEECIKRLRGIDPNVRAIVSSGYSNDPVMAQYERFGFAGVVAKPYQLTELSQAMRAVIGPERTECRSSTPLR